MQKESCKHPSTCSYNLFLAVITTEAFNTAMYLQTLPSPYLFILCNPEVSDL